MRTRRGFFLGLVDLALEIVAPVPSRTPVADDPAEALRAHQEEHGPGDRLEPQGRHSEDAG